MKKLKNSSGILLFFQIILIGNIIWFGKCTAIYFINPHPQVNVDQEENEETTEDRKKVAISTEDFVTTTESSVDEKKTNKKNPLKQFYYEQLSSNEKKAYKDVYEGLIKRKERIKVFVHDTEGLQKVYRAVLYDHAEIFWCDLSYRYNYHNAFIKYYELMPQYFYSKAEIESKKSQIKAEASKCLSKISKSETDYNKLLYVFKYLIQNTEYDQESLEKGETGKNQNIDSAFLNHLTVCAGYSRATQYLLDQLDIPCTYVTGNSVTKEGRGPHGWNLVQCKGQYYYMDVTWGDPGFTQNTPNVTEEMKINYVYFNCNERTLFRTHELDNQSGYTYPKCEKMDWNYYVVNKRYFKFYDKNNVYNCVKEDIDHKAKMTSFLFSNQKAYQEAKKNLDAIIEVGRDRNLEKYGISGDTIYYNKDDDTYKLSIYWKY